jgi:hypothetical protein
VRAPRVDDESLVTRARVTGIPPSASTSGSDLVLDAYACTSIAVCAGRMSHEDLIYLLVAALELFEAAEKTEDHPDRARYRLLSAAVARFGAVALALDVGLADRDAAARQLERSLAGTEAHVRAWASELTPRKHWLASVRGKLLHALSSVLADDPEGVSSEVADIVVACVDLLDWLRGRGRSRVLPYDAV